MENKISIENVCSYIQISYAHDYKQLKEKSKKFLFKNRQNVDPIHFKALPMDIVFEIFSSKF